MLQRILLTLTLVVGGVSTTLGGEGCCSHCQCHQVRKVCVPVTEVIKETTYEYACECEDFCVPGPSKCVGYRCETDCDGCTHRVKVMQPTCGTVFTRNVLLKIPVVKERCVTKWVVKTICCGCNEACSSCTCPVGAPPTELGTEQALEPPHVPVETALQLEPRSPNDVLPIIPVPQSEAIRR